MDSLDDLKKKRFYYLKKLYELSGGNEHKFLSMWIIGDQLGFDRDLTTSIAQYLKGEGLLEFRALGGIISITHYGNKEVEENLKKRVQTIETTPVREQLSLKTDLSSNEEDNILTQFWSKIEGSDIWKYCEIKACFIRYYETDVWKITFLRIELLNEKRNVDYVDLVRPRLRLMRSIHKIDILKKIINEISSSNTVTINSETGSLEFFGRKYRYNVITRTDASATYEVDYPCHALGAAGVYPTEVMMDTQRFLRDVLPLDDPPYFDLRHVCKKELSIEHGTPAFGVFFAILAPIYIRMENIEFNDKEIRLDIYDDDATELKRQNLRLVLFGLDELGQPTDFVLTPNLHTTEDKLTYSKKIQYNQPIASLNYKLYYDRVLIEDNIKGKHTISVTPKNWSKNADRSN